MTHFVTVNAGEIVEIFDARRGNQPEGAIPVTADPAALRHGRHDELTIVGDRLVVDPAKIGQRERVQRERRDARRVALASANSIPALRDIVQSILDELGL